MNIRVLGTKSSGHQLVVSIVNQFLQKANIPYTLSEEDDITVFLKEGLSSVPAIQSDGDTYSLSHNGSFNKSLRDAIHAILKKKNFGDMDKVVIPVDFSDVSMNAFMYGHRLSTDIGAVTKALHVYFPTSRELTEASVIDVNFRALREDHLNRFVKKFDVDWGSDVLKTALIDAEFRVGFPGEEILDSVEENACELLVMGTTGDSSRIKKWFGSVSTKMMNEAPCPILLIPEKASYKGINKILYAYDDINLDSKILHSLTAFAKKHEAQLHFLHINEEGESDPGFYLKEQMGELYDLDRVIFANFSSFEVADSIQNYAADQGIDILALATKSRSFFGKIFHDSISQKIALHSEIPLLVLK